MFVKPFRSALSALRKVGTRKPFWRGTKAPIAQERGVLRNVQALRAVAALAVVFAHIGDSNGFEQRWLSGNRNWTGFASGAGQAGVDLFFVISGLIMVVTTHQSKGGGRTAKRFLQRRILRIYPAYWVATLPVLALFVVSPHMVNDSADARPQVLASLLLLPQPGLPLLLVGWTLTFEMYFYLVFALVLLLPRAGRFPALMGWGILTLTLAVVLAESPNPWLSTVGAPIALDFLFGAMVGQFVVRGLYRAPVWFTVAGGVGVVAATAFGPFPGVWYRAVPVGLLLALVVYGIVGLEHDQRFVAPGWAQKLGDASYSMYLWHVLILTALGRFFWVHMPGAVWVHVLALLSSVFLVVVGSLLAYRWVEQPMTNLLRPITATSPRPRRRTRAVRD